MWHKKRNKKIVHIAEMKINENEIKKKGHTVNNSHGADVEDIPFGIEVRRPVVEFPAREALDVICQKK